MCWRLDMWGCLFCSLVSLYGHLSSELPLCSGFPTSHIPGGPISALLMGKITREI